MTPDEAIETLREAIGPRDLPHLGPTSGWAQHAETLHRERHEALDRMASLAREVADLLDWADNIAHATRRRDQALRIYWEFPTLATARTRSDGIDWWERYERYQKRVEALLAEFDVLREKQT